VEQAVKRETMITMMILLRRDILEFAMNLFIR
jgi:hypothetical protein